MGKYVVSSVTPIPIYPSGMQGAQAVLNLGTRIVLLGDIANGQGTPVVPGGHLVWEKERPLYACLAEAGEPCSIQVDACSGTVSLTGAYEVGEAVQSGTSVPMLYDGELPAGESIEVDTSSCESVLLKFRPPGGVLNTFHDRLFVEWRDGDGNYFTDDTVAYLRQMTFSQDNILRLRTKGQRLRLRVFPLNPLESLSVTMIPTILTDAYEMPGEDLAATGGICQTVPGVIANGADFTWYPELRTGLVWICGYFGNVAVGAGGVYLIVELTSTGAIIARHWYSTMAELYGVHETVHIPRSPCRIRIANRAGVAINCASLTVVYD